MSMKFIISTQELDYLVSKCLNIVGPKPAAPILGNLLIQAANDELIITATDLTVGIRSIAEAKILVEGAATLPVRRLSQLLKELTAANIEISTNANEITEIIADASRFKLNGMAAEDFPVLPDLKEAFQFKVKQADFRNMLYYTAFAVSRDDNRYTLTGVCLTIANGMAIFAGTDGKRLARAHMKIDVDPSFKASYILPLKAVEEIQKSLMDEGEATVFLVSDKLAVEAGTTTIITKLLAGDYPDISRIIPQKLDIQVSLHREELVTLLRQVSLFTTLTVNSVRFTFGGGELKMCINSPEGEGKVGMPANYYGDVLDIAFNPGFFLDILRHMKGETISLGLIDGYNPGCIMEEQAQDLTQASPLYILMPMRLNEE